MMTKPPGTATNSSFPPDEDDDESIDDSLEDILLAANEKAFENVAAVTGELAPESPRPPSDVTLITARPSVADDVVEEETKVEPADAALRAASKEGDGLALTAQASEQRDRALRKGSPSAQAAARSNGHEAHESDDLEFEDPDAPDGDDADAFAAGSLTPADIPISETEDDEPVPAAASGAAISGSMSSAASGPPGSTSGSFAAALPSSGPITATRLPPPGRKSMNTPPPGRPEAYTARRLPTPSPDYVGGSSGYASGAHYPSIPIPAPSIGSSPVAVRSDDKPIRLRVGGFAGVLGAAFMGGLLVGAVIWRGSAHPAATVVAAKAEATSTEAAKPAAKAEPIAPIVEPVQPAAVVAAAPAPSAGAVATAKPSGGSTPTATAIAAATTTGTTSGTTTADTAEPAAPRPVHHVAAPKVRKVASADLDAPVKPAAPKATTGKPAGGKKKATAWQDPFAQ